MTLDVPGPGPSPHPAIASAAAVAIARSALRLEVDDEGLDRLCIAAYETRTVTGAARMYPARCACRTNAPASVGVHETVP